MNFKKLFFAAVIVLSANASFGQDTESANHNVTINIPNIALLDLEFETGVPILLAGEVLNDEAGLPISFVNAKNSDTWINYTSIVSKTATTTRNVTVALSGTSDAVPTGLKLTVTAGAYAGGEGAGDLGAPTASPIAITTTATSIINTIGSAYTGNTAGRGHQLTYQLGYDTDAATDYADLDSDASAVLNIVYTLSDI